MDLRRLEYFLAVVEHGRVTAAAQALHVAQPSLSQAIRALERDLGAELFVRNGRGLAPTEAGLALIEPARRVLAGLAAAKAAVGNVIDLSAGWLDVAAHDRLGYDPLAGVLAAFHRRHGGVPVRLHEPRTEDELVRMVVDGRCELGLAYLSPELTAGDPDPVPGTGAAAQAAQVGQATLVVRPIGQHEVWALFPPGTRVADPAPLGALAGWHLVDSMTGFGVVRVALLQATRAAGVRMRPAVRTRHLEAIAPLVAAGVGVAFTTPGYAQEAARSGVVARRLDVPFAAEYALLHRPGGLSPAARGFVAVLYAQLGHAQWGQETGPDGDHPPDLEV